MVNNNLIQKSKVSKLTWVENFATYLFFSRMLVLFIGDHVLILVNKMVFLRDVTIILSKLALLLLAKLIFHEGFGICVWNGFVSYKPLIISY